jgi:hypothetical protein
MILPSQAALACALLALAGCVTPAAVESASAPGEATLPAASAAPFHAEGTYWLKPTQGNERATHEIPFTVNASGMRVVAKLSTGERYGPVDLFTSTSDVEAELVAPDGTSLQKASRPPGGPTMLKLEGVANAVGEGKLVLRTYGGSDEGQGGGFGDYVEFVLDAS